MPRSGSMKWILRIGRAAMLLLVAAIAGLFATGNGLDDPLFHMDIRENAQFRVDTYLQATAPLPVTDATRPERSLMARANGR